MCAAEPPNTQLRDKLLAKLLAESLAASPAKSAACPDAETIAAYADRGLPAEETARLDIHFADCADCQAVLAALALSLEEVPENIPAQLPAQLLARSPASAAVAAPPSASATPVRTMPRPQPTRWRELAPALGIAAAVALWFAMRPVPPAQDLSAQLKATNETSASTTPPAPKESEIAEANIPAPPAPPPALPAASASAPASPRESQQLSAEALQRDFQQEDNLEKAESAKKSPSPDTNSAAELSAIAAATQAQAGAAGVPAAPAPSFAPGATPTPPAPDDAKRMAPANAASPAAPRRAAVVALAAVVEGPAFSALGGAVMWRVGAGGNIERSSDRGLTWDKQVSGVSTDLLAGAATSNEVAWIVGRAGVILRTTDGINWQRVSLTNGGAGLGSAIGAATQSTTLSTAPAPTAKSLATAPPTAPPDLAGVEARDALHATVIAANGRRFATSDGGQTWTPQ